MIRSKTALRLDVWLQGAKTSLVSSFVNGIEKDITAVRNAILSPWSNGQTEGQITRLKSEAPDVRSRKARSAAGPNGGRNLGVDISKYASEPDQLERLAAEFLSSGYNLYLKKLLIIS